MKKSGISKLKKSKKWYVKSRKSSLACRNLLLLLRIQFQLSPAEHDLVKQIRRCGDKLHSSLAQVDETLLVLELFLKL